MRIDDGQGKGYQAGVDKTNRLKTVSIAVPQQHHASIDHGNAFQIAGEYTVAASGTYTVLNVVNDSTNEFLVGTYLRPQVAGLTGGTFGTATYMTLNFGGARSTGGTAVTAVNMNQSSGNAALLTAYGSNPTLTGTLTEFDRWYPEQGTDNFVYNKEGTLLLGSNDSVSIQFVTDHTAGLVRFRMSFFMFKRDHHA